MLHAPLPSFAATSRSASRGQHRTEPLRAPASRPLQRNDATQSNGERVEKRGRWPPVDTSSNRNGVLVALCWVLYCRVVPTAYNLQQCTRAHAPAYITLVINCIHILKYSAHALKYFESRPPASHPSPCPLNPLSFSTLVHGQLASPLRFTY